MGKSRPRAAEKRVLGQGSIVLTSDSSLTIPPAPVYYPTEDEFKDPLAFIYKIRPEAESYGICKIVPPPNWKPPFALDLDTFSFPTKTQAIHQLQARPPACNPKTFELEYNRFLEDHCGKKAVKKKVVFEGKELDMCKLFNAVKRYGGYDNVVKEKKWGEVFRFVRSGGKISKCSKYVLCQLYKEHLYDYENYYSKLDRVKEKSCKREMQVDKKTEKQSSKRSRVNEAGDKVKLHKVENEQFDQICEQCRSGLHAEVMLLCDRCNKGWHIYCLSPPLKRVPPGNWYCSECFNSEKDSFGFVPGKQLTLDAFRRVADRAKKKWFGSTSASRVELEKKFWEIVEGSVGEVEVIYGSDLDTSVYGSGFPRVDDQRLSSIDVDGWDEYCASPWNLNNLPKLQGSMLQAVHHNIAGVMVPWLYIGMLFSSFCWHFEDHCFYSMNYHHWGEPKCWYSVPGSEASAFEKVMRNSLPDLFDAQPDLLFQLVTMLNPSVLQENNVPVYSVLQEPGNFVITFPRSYHGGFNFGLNCAEAVNFAPADWLPYGGFGAELYQHYRKAAVLSHEELLCVVAKNDFDSETLPYLKNELLRVFNKEKSWRERIWKNGIISSSPMAPRKQPNYVGVEEDATCIICQQFLYLSAVGCSCRPSAFVCLEHWENICECKPRKRHLRYRHTLAELNDLVIMTEKHTSEEMIQKRNSRKQLTLTNEVPSLSKKVKGGQVTITQLAEEWLLRSCKILQMPYSADAYATALKEAEQFLWAGSEMDPVREVATNLSEAKNWAEGVRDCLSRIENNSEVERVKMEDVNTLLNVSPVPCNEPGHLKLKGYEEEAKELIQEISSALSTGSNVSIVDLEKLNSKASESAIYVKESKELSTKLSAVKRWLRTVKKCISEKSPGVIEVEIVNTLKSEIIELQLQVPEVPIFLDFVKKVELCQSRCNEILRGSVTLKNLEVLIREYDGFTVNVPELNLVRQYQNDAFNWISRFNNVVKNIHEREDQENVVDELVSLEKDGSLLKVQVDELVLVDVELKKASCRVEAWKVLRSKMPLEAIQQVMAKATELQIENEKVFKKISDVLTQAVSLEEKAKHILACEVQMSEFEDVLRMSEDLCALIPSIDGVKEALLMAKPWLNKSIPYLSSDLSVIPVESSLLKVDNLKELVSESKSLKIYLEERSLLEDVLHNYIQWEKNACSTLHDAESLLNILDVGDEISADVISKIDDHVAKMESIMKADLSLRFDFPVIPKIREICSILHWCFKTLAFRAVDHPTLKEVEMLLEDANCHHLTYASRPFWRLFIDGINWLKKSAEILGQCNRKRFDLSDVEEALRQSKMIKISFPLIVGRLLDAIKRHNVWVDKVRAFFRHSTADRSWSLLLQLEELGSSEAYNCMEMDKVVSQVQKVKEWKQRCGIIVGVKVGDHNLLINALSQIVHSLDRSLYMYNKPDACNDKSLCMFCANDSQDRNLSTCSVCMDCYHMQCIKSTSGGTSHTTAHICSYCHIIESGKISRLKIDAKRPELDMFIKLLSDADNLCVEIKEKAIIRQIVEKSVANKDYLTKIVDFSINSLGEDLSIVVWKLSTALKAVEVAGVYDRESNCKFEVALARNSWRVRASKLLNGSQKPSIHQIQRLLKEGLTINVPLEDHFWHKLTTIKDAGLQWAAKAKKVSADSGALELHKVFELIAEGESFPVHFDKELKLLRERSMLYCICRKPYDQRPMIACDKCDEWYHFDCIKLSSAPKSYICPACDVDAPNDNKCTSSSIQQERSNGECEEPQTPSPRPVERSKSNTTRKVGENDEISTKRRSGIERLLWRNRKPFRREAKKRVEFEIFSPFFHVH